MTDLTKKGLGYSFVYDERAAAYPMRAYMDADEIASAPSEILHERGPILDQKNEGACVSFGHAAVINAGPTKPATMLANADAQRYYKRAQDLDEWPGNDYSGTSNQAGAKTYREAGYYEAFAWASNPTEMKQYVLTRGPVAWTCKWRKGMYQTDAQGYLKATGEVVGGHLLCCIGIRSNGDYVVQNSWGEDFGKGGICYVAPETMHALYAEGHWTACAPVEVGQKVDPKPEPPQPTTLPRVTKKKFDDGSGFPEHFIITVRGKDRFDVKKIS